MFRAMQEMEFETQKQIITAKLAGNSSVPATPEEQEIATTVHAIFEKYDFDKDDLLNQEEVKPFIINFSQKVLGMNIQLANSQEIIRDIYKELAGGGPGASLQ